MNTRNRPGRNTGAVLAGVRPSPYGLGTPSGTLPARTSVHAVMNALEPNPACTIQSGRLCRHPLTNDIENRRLLAHERTIKERFANIVPVLKRIAGLQHAPDFVEQAQAIAVQELGFSLRTSILADAWATELDMRALYGESVLGTLRLLAEQTRVATPAETGEGSVDEAM